MKHHSPRVVASVILLLAVAGTPARSQNQPLFTEDLCASDGGSVGLNWVSLPTTRDLLTAEDVCRAIPSALTVAEGPPSGVGTAPRLTFDCVTGACTSSAGVVPEPGCLTSACFCLDDGEGIEVRTRVDTGTLNEPNSVQCIDHDIMLAPGCL